MADMTIKSVGVVRSDIQNPSLAARSGDLHWDGKGPAGSHQSERVSEIAVHADYAGILDGIEEFSHLLVLYWADRVPDEARTYTRVHPMGRKDMPLVGVFATCSPARPNPVLVIAVRLLERRGMTLRVAGLDAVDGSPVIDIKPYLPPYYAVTDARLSGWMKRLLDEMAQR